MFTGVGYDLSETTVAGYTAGTWSCDGGTRTGSNIQVPLGGQVTCTIHNTDNTPQLKLVKIVSGGTAVPNDFTLSATAAAPNNGRNFSNFGGLGAFQNVFANATYTLSETTVTGYTPGNWSCNGGTVVGATVTLPLGAHVTCSITNTRDQGSLRVTKWHDLNANGIKESGEPVLSGWVMFIDLNQNGVFNTGEPTATTNASGEALFSAVNTGSYWVCETLQATWLNSKPGAASVSPAGTQPCQSVTITKSTETAASFGNFKKGTIIVEKQTIPNGAPGQFTFTGTAAGTIADNGTITVNNLMPGNYTSSEADPSGLLFDLTSIVCNDGDSTGSINAGGAGGTATFRLQSGETVRCVFTNTKNIHPGTIGFWRNWRNQYTTAQFQTLINYLKTNNPAVYNKDQDQRHGRRPDDREGRCDLQLRDVDAGQPEDPGPAHGRQVQPRDHAVGRHRRLGAEER